MSLNNSSCSQLLLLFFILIGLYIAPSWGLYRKTTETSSSPFAKKVVKKFGMAKGGLITIDFTVEPQYSALPYDGYTLILVTNEDETKGFYSDLDDSTITNPAVVANFCIQPSMARVVASGSGSYNMTIAENYQSDQYSILLLQCRMGISSNPLKIDVRINMKNPRPTGTSYSHLGIENVNLIRIFGGQGILYMMLILAIAGQFIFYRPQIKGIHYLFAATLLSAFLVAMLDYNYYLIYDQQGFASQGAEIAADVFAAVADSFALGTIFLLSLGWTLLRSQLTERERRLVGYAVLSFFFFSLGSAVCVSDSPICTSVSLVAFILRNLLLLAIIVAMNFTVTHLRILLTHSPWVPSTPIQYARCKQFQIFRFVYILYLFLPTIIYIVETTSFTWKENWIVVALNEMTTIAMLFFVGITFSPMQEAFLLRSFDGSINAVRR